MNEPVNADSMGIEGYRGGWALTKEGFARLLAEFDPDRDRAGEQYEIVRRKLIKFFEWRGNDSPEDHADEVINRVARKLEAGELVANLNSYFYGVARRLLLEKIKEGVRRREAVDELSAAADVPDPEIAEAAPRRSECFELCMQKLDANSRTLILGYYQEERRAKIDHRNQIANDLGIPLNALRIRAHRIRAKLEECVRDCTDE